MQKPKLSPEVQAQLQAAAISVSRGKGAVLFHAGEPCRGAFLIRSGRIKLSLEGNEDLYPTRFLGEGTVVGLPATLSGEAYSLTAETAERCRLSFIPRRKLLNLVRRDAAVATQILLLLSEEIYQMRKAAKAAASRVRKRNSRRKARPPEQHSTHALG